MITTALEFGFQADHLDSNGITWGGLEASLFCV